MKTPIQELIEEYQQMRENGDNDMRTVIFLARQMLEKEKEVIISAANNGCKGLCYIDISRDGENYYNERFNTKEK